MFSVIPKIGPMSLIELSFRSSWMVADEGLVGHAVLRSLVPA